MQKAALITGAGTGIGAATAQALARDGYRVFLLGRRREMLEKTADGIPGAEIAPCDLAQASEVEALASRLLDLPVDWRVLVNNAGVFERAGTPQGTDELWSRQFEINLLGPVRLVRAFWPRFTRQMGGSIVNVSSTLGLNPTADTAAYAAVKAGMVSWTKSLALEGGPHGIRVNCVCPGLVDTPIHSFHFLHGEEKESSLKKMASLQPLGRVGRPEEIAESIAFLAGERSSWTTGAILSVDGGINLV